MQKCTYPPFLFHKAVSLAHLPQASHCALCALGEESTSVYRPQQGAYKPGHCATYWY
jgi:hypothetical protein